MWKRLIDLAVHAPRRRIDIQILWPECVKHARDLERAKAAFALHVFNDKAWTVLGKAEVARVIDGLT